MPSLRLRLVPKLSALLSVLFLCVFCSTARAAATITVSSPASGATVNCVVTVAASMTFTPPDQQGDAVEFYFVDNLGNKTSLTGNPVQWDTTHMSNGTVSIYATVPYHEGYTYYMANSALITVTVQNGYYLNTDSTKTFAKVNSPTSGQVVPTDGSQFTVNTDHQITWTRYDNCQGYPVSYSWKQSTTWKPLTELVDPTSGVYTTSLPLRVGDVAVRRLGWVNTYIGSLPTGAFTADAYCYTGASNVVAHGFANFTVAIPK